MTDTNGTTTAPAKATRAKASDRLHIDATGKEVDKIDLATGIRYVIPANGRSFDVQFSDVPDQMKIAAWAFGLHTKLGNEANTVRNDKANPGTPDDEADALEEFLADYMGGVWSSPSDGPRGPKYDNTVLAAVLCQMAHAIGKTDRTPEFFLEKLQDRKLRPQYLAGAGVKEAYAIEAEKRGLAKPAAPKVLAADLL